MAAVSVQCSNPQCRARARVDESLLGKRGKCPKCGTSFVLRRAESSTPGPAGAIPADATPAAGEQRPRGPDGIPLTWEPGDLILDLYEVQPLREGLPFAEGGMGRVNRVWHRQWRTHLAVKSVHPGRLKNTQAVEHFKGEAEEWVNRIGLHPNVVSCFYVRVLGGLPRVFVEFVNGGSLAEWIQSGRLYEGGQEQALRRMLDIAIQFAWGLHYVHELGLIHQDVKPLNVMMSADGIAKVTDFGLANARAKAFREGQDPPAGHTLLATWGGMTLAYCSPEQAAIQAQRKKGAPLGQSVKLTRRTDVWSWAVSVLEMFLGGIAWPSGSVAYIGLTRETEDPRIPKMPAPIRELLQRCFQKEAGARPHDLDEIADVLHRVYEQMAQETYPRRRPRAADALADTLNNRAVSLLDLGKPPEAERLWEQALKVDPQHAETTYNLGLVRWRAARTDDLQVIERLQALRDAAPQDWVLRGHLAQAYVERGDCAGVVRALEGISRDVSPELGKLCRWARSHLPHSRRCLYTFEEDLSGVWAVSLSGDGRVALSGSYRSLKLWEPGSGRCLRTFGEPAESVSISRDGKLAVSRNDGVAVRLWETSSGRCLRTFWGHGDKVTAVSLSGDGRLALSGSGDRTARLWETATGNCLKCFQGHLKEVRAVRLSRDNHLVLSGGHDCTARLWEVASGRCLHVLQGHTGSVTGVSLSGDSQLALTGSVDRTLKLWETPSGRCLRTFQGHRKEVMAVSLSEDGSLALSGSFDNTLKLWETSTGRCLHTFEGHTDKVWDVSLCDDGRLAFSGSFDGTGRLWDTSWKAKPAPFALSRGQSLQRLLDAQAATDHALATALSALDEGKVSEARQWVSRIRQQRGYERSPQVLPLWRELAVRLPRQRLTGAYLLHTLEGHVDEVRTVALTLDGKQALSGSHDRTVKLWNTADGRCLQTLQGHTNTVTAVSLTLDGRLALSGSDDRTARLWETSSGKCLCVFQGHKDMVKAVSLNGDGRLALTGSHDRTAVLWDATKGQCLQQFKGHAGGITAVVLSADGQYAVSGSDDHTVKLWETCSGRCLRTCRGHKLLVSAVSLTFDASLMLSGSWDSIKLWETRSGHCLHTLQEEEGKYIEAVSLSIDGRLALTGGNEGTAQLWDNGKVLRLHTLLGHADWVRGVALSGDVCLAITGSNDSTAKLWFLDWELGDAPAAEWDDGVRPLLEAFLSCHTPYVQPPEDHRWLTCLFRQKRVFARQGPPVWTEEAFQQLLYIVGCAGYGHLPSDTVRRELQAMAAHWQWSATLV